MFGTDFEPKGGCEYNSEKDMEQPTYARKVLHATHLVRVLAGAVLLAAFSWEILLGPNHRVSQGYMTLQLIVCLLFLADFGVGWLFAPRPKHYLLRHLLYLLLSVPWLNLIAWSGVSLPRPWMVIFSMMPVWLLVMSLYFVIEWLGRMRIQRLFVTYLAAMLLSTYLSALIFYEVEGAPNASMQSFGDALWWAGQNLTTLGATIQPTTPIGKMLTVLLPLLGMLFLPIFTTYIMNTTPTKKG